MQSFIHNSIITTGKEERECAVSEGLAVKTSLIYQLSTNSLQVQQNKPKHKQNGSIEANC